VIRLLCHADASPIGQVALAYADAIRDNGRAFSYAVVSLIAADLAPPTDAAGKPMPKAAGWHHHATKFRVDLKAPWTNVVCAPARGPFLDWGKLHTAKVRNVLLAGDEAPDAMAARYDAIAILEGRYRSAWAQVVDVEKLYVVRPDDARALAELLTG
jgi:hypothetical protein